MALLYVWNGATGTATGADWANAKLTLTAAFTTEVVGDTIFVAHDHNEVTAGVVSLTSSGIATDITEVICVDRFGSVPPVSADRRATAQVSTSGAVGINMGGGTHFDGIIFKAGSGTTGSSGINLGSSNGSMLRLDNCSLRLGVNSGSQSVVQFGGASASVSVLLNNTTVSLANASHRIELYGLTQWRNTPAALLGTMPPTLFTVVSNRGLSLECIGVDFSAFSGTLVGASAGSSSASIRFIDCKLHPSVIRSVVPTIHGSHEIDFLRSGSANTNSIRRHRNTGLLIEESSIIRPGGSSDGSQVTSWKIETTSHASYNTPFETQPIAIWNDAVDVPITAIVECIWLNNVTPKTNEIWLDVEYLADETSLLASFVNDGRPDLLAPIEQQTQSFIDWTFGAVMPATAWDVGTAALVTVSGAGNLVLTNTGGSANEQGAHAPVLNRQNSGKYYFEIALTATNGSNWGDAFGIGTVSSTYTGMASNGTTGVVISRNAGIVWANGVNMVEFGAQAAGQTWGMAVDLDNRKIWFRRVSGTPNNWNNNVSADPATNVGGFTIPSGEMIPFATFGGTFGQNGNVRTANFGGLVPFVGVVPSGFVAGWSPQPETKTFKLESAFTAAQPGWIYARVKVGKPSSTFYVDPLVSFGSLPPGTGKWLAAFNQPLNISAADFNGTNIRQWIGNGLIGESGTRFRLTLQSGSGAEGAQISSMYAGHAATGSGMDFDGSQVQILVGGSATFTVPPNSTIVTDQIDYPFNSGKDFLVAAYFDNAAHDTVRGRDSFAGADFYSLVGPSETSVANVGGYVTATNTLRFVTKIEVWQP